MILEGIVTRCLCHPFSHHGSWRQQGAGRAGFWARVRFTHFLEGLVWTPGILATTHYELLSRSLCSRAKWFGQFLKRHPDSSVVVEISLGFPVHRIKRDDLITVSSAAAPTRPRRAVYSPHGCQAFGTPRSPTFVLNDWVT